MVSEASSHADEDRRKKQLAEARNEADNLIYSVEKSIKDYGDKLSGGEKAEIEKAIESARKAMDENDIEKIRAATTELSRASHKLAEEIYGQMAGKGAEAGGSAGSRPADEGVVDAQFEEVDKEKK
jgi:molecular chaperone DnaK